MTAILLITGNDTADDAVKLLNLHESASARWEGVCTRPSLVAASLDICSLCQPQEGLQCMSLLVCLILSWAGGSLRCWIFLLGRLSLSLFQQLLQNCLFMLQRKSSIKLICLFGVSHAIDASAVLSVKDWMGQIPVNV